MSEVKVNKITPTADCGTVTLGDSGDTVAIPTGVTLTSAGSITNSGTITNTGTISGGTISGTIDGQVNWQTTVKTTAFTATAGEGYFCNTTSAAFTVTLPASPSAGDIVGIKDYANTADTNNITIGRNGSNIQGTANDFVIDTEGLAIILLYVDATKGWLSVGQSKAADISEQALFVTATGGTVTTSGNFKIHTFTGPGTFCVSCAGNSQGSSTVDYMVIAGGAAGGSGGGGGAGGYMESSGAASGCYTASPLGACVSALPVTAQGYPITVGGGGAGYASGPNTTFNNGSNSIFSTITSAGGGAGGNHGPNCVSAGRNGGSGGGGSGTDGGAGPGGTGNTPPVSPPQGKNGGTIPGPTPGTAFSGGGGGGATAAGDGTGSAGVGADGGAGATTSINGTPTARAGGGGGGSYTFGGGGSPGSGGTGGGGAGGNSGGTPTGQAGTANTGSGGGGRGVSPTGHGNPTSGAGGSGIVIIRYKFQ